MRVLIAIVLLVTSAFAQHRGGFSGGFGRGGGFRGGFGRPGMIGGTVRPGAGHFGMRPGFRPGFGGTFFRGRFGGGFHKRGFHGGGFGFWGGSIYPYYSGFSTYGSMIPYAPVIGDWYSMAQPYTSPAVVIVTNEREDPPPSGRSVVINNTVVHPWRQQDYRVERNRADETGPIVYLIALNDGRAWAAVAYWVDGSTLHLVTRRNEQMTFPIDEVDRSLSERLNRERGVPFRLP